MPNPGSGLSSSVGTGIEGTYGTAAAPTRWTTPTNAKFKLNPVFVQGQGLRAGTLVEDVNDRVWAAADVGGTMEHQFYRNGMGQLIGSLMGSLSGSNAGTPVQQGATIAYLQTHNLGTNTGQSLTIQQGIYDTTGTAHRWDVLGAKVVQGQFECNYQENLKATFTIDGMDRIESGSSLAAPTLLTGNQVYGWPNMVVKVGAFGSEAQVNGVNKWAATIKRVEADKRFNAGNITANAAGYGIKSEPVDEGFFDITGTLDTEFIDTTKFVDVFMTNTTFSMIVSFTGPIIASSFNYAVTFKFPACKYTGGDPEVDGPVIVKPQLPFKVLNDDTHTPATITIMATDTAL